MNKALLFLVLAGAAVAAPSAGPGPGPDGAALARSFALLGPDYKKPRDVPDMFFNPFKIEPSFELSAQKRGAAVSEQGVADAVGRRGVSGIVYAADAGMNQVIIGDQVFRIGDELTFPDGSGGQPVPLVAGASVVLREVGRNTLVFDFAADGEAAHRSSFSLQGFWKP